MESGIRKYLAYTLMYNLMFTIFLSQMVIIKYQYNTLYFGLLMLNGLIITYSFLGLDLINPDIEYLIERMKMIKKGKK